MAMHTREHPFKVGAAVRVIERRTSGTVEHDDRVAAIHKGNGNFFLEGTGSRQFKPYSLPQGDRVLWRAHAVGAPAGAVYEVRPIDRGPGTSVPPADAREFANAVERLRNAPAGSVTPGAVLAVQAAVRALKPLGASR